MDPNFPLHHHLGHRWRRSTILRTPWSSQERDSDVSDPDRELLLVVLASMLHVTDESSHRAYIGPESSHCHEDEVGRHPRRQQLINDHKSALIELECA